MKIIKWAGNILALVVLGLILQIGGAYLVNAAVIVFSDGASAVSDAAGQYKSFMESIRAIEPRQFVHIIFVGPLVEELVFRLIFLRAGKMIMPFWAANLVQAVLFGVYHTVSFQRVYAFVMALIIGCVFYYCPRIYRNHTMPEKPGDMNAGSRFWDLPDSIMGVAITFLLHVVINAAGLFVAPLAPVDIAIPVQITAGLILMGIAGAACVLLWKRSEGTKNL